MKKRNSTGNKRAASLIDAAKRARTLAYCPYSRYAVGASVLTRSGRIFAGANVENASYGLSLCAERVAIFNAVTHGEKEIKAVCIVGRKARPCGACRQVMIEFSTKETQLILVDLDSRRETVVKTPVYSTLPGAFNPLDSGVLPPNPQNLPRLSRPKRTAKQRKH